MFLREDAIGALFLFMLAAALVILLLLHLFLPLCVQQCRDGGFGGFGGAFILYLFTDKGKVEPKKGEKKGFFSSYLHDSLV